MHYALNRSYSALVVKFTSIDPSRTSASSAEPQSWNRYAYTGNDPVNKTDETGLDDSDAQDPGEDSDLEDMAVAPSAAVCNAILPADEDGQLAVSVVLGEATPLERINQPTYQTDDKFGHPSGSGTVDDQAFFDEAIAMVSVIANRANDRHKPWRKIITQSQFHGLKRGKKLLKRYQEYFPGTLQCNELNRAADAVFVMRVGEPVYTFRYWVAIFNSGYRKGKFARPLGGATRIADTDFSDNPF